MFIFYRPEIVAQTVRKMIETATHGSFWSVEGSKAYEVQFSVNDNNKKEVNDLWILNNFLFNKN